MESFILGEIGSHNNEIADIERSIRSMQNDMTKLNQLITKEHGYKIDLQQSNILMENDFIHSLRVRPRTLSLPVYLDFKILSSFPALSRVWI